MMIFTTASFGSGISSNTATAPCTNNTLETYSGNSNLSADWQPNEIKLKWYNNNTLLDVQSSANTCVYDGILTIPQTAPTRTGYTFAGWTVIPEYDFSTLPTNETGLEAYGTGDSGYHVCYKRGSIKEGDACRTEDFIDGFNDLDTLEWKTIFSWGTIYGMSMCSSTTGTESGESGTPSATDGQYCWCKATGYIPNNENTKYSPKRSGWVYNSNAGSICKWVCAGRCALWQGASFLTGLFNSQ